MWVKPHKPKMKPKILIIEDEAEIADTIQYALESEAFSTHWVTTGQAALQILDQNQKILDQNQIELIILDIGLPDISGFELLKLIREKWSLPVIFLTARNDEVDRIVGLEIGADDYVSKPFSPRELVARVKVILRRVLPTPTEGNLPFESDPQRAQIRFQNQILPLTKAEYLLLSTLLTHPQQVYSRTQLMDKIWESSHPSDERTIDTHIKTIRAKLRTIDNTLDPVTTHRGLGYSINLNRKTNNA